MMYEHLKWDKRAVRNAVRNLITQLDKEDQLYVLEKLLTEDIEPDVYEELIDILNLTPVYF